MKRTETIHIHLLSEGVDVWRPVEAAPLGENRYRVVSENGDPEGENWQFKTGHVVRCVRRRLSDGECLVAVEKTEED